MNADARLEKLGVSGLSEVDEPAFTGLAERHRRELHVHCYRMLGSFDEAEDLVQETLLRAWRGRESFDGGPGFRAWLYRIATNACLDALRSRRRIPALHSFAEVPWLQPYPDRLLDELAPSDSEPDAVVVARETIELTFLAVIQLLPPRQRAVLIFRDVLDWSAAETAALLDMSVAAANSALQRARATLRQRLPARPSEWSGSAPSEEERQLLEAFIDAHERADATAAAALARDDIRITMPPHPWCFDGLDAIRPLLEEGLTAPGEWRLLPTRANRQPTAASYLRAHGDAEFRAFTFDVLRIEGGRIAEITTSGPACSRRSASRRRSDPRSARGRPAGHVVAPPRRVAETGVEPLAAGPPDVAGPGSRVPQQLRRPGDHGTADPGPLGGRRHADTADGARLRAEQRLVDRRAERPTEQQGADNGTRPVTRDQHRGVQPLEPHHPVRKGHRLEGHHLRPFRPRHHLDRHPRPCRPLPHPDWRPVPAQVGHQVDHRVVELPPPRLEEPNRTRQIVRHPRPDVIVPTTTKPDGRGPELPEPRHPGLQQPRADALALIGRVNE